MKPNRIELFLFLILICLLTFRLLDHQWVTVFLYLDFFSLIGLWIWGYKKSEFWQRIFSIPLILGFILTTTNTNFNNLFTILGLVCLTIYCLIGGIRILSKKDISTGIELLFVSLVLLGYFFRLMHYAGGGIIRVVSMSLLQILYFAMSIEFLVTFCKEKHVLSGILGMFLLWILSIYICVILFDTMFWPGTLFMFWCAVIPSLIVIPVMVILSYRKNTLSENLRIQLYRLFKRLVIITGIAVFFVVATPQQFLRFDFGNRPQIIEADYNCRLNDNMDEMMREKNCEEFQQLLQLIHDGLYAQGASNDELKELKKEREKQY